MGLAVICGCCGAVGLLLHRSIQVFAQLMRRPVDSLFLKGIVIILGCVIGASMMFGLAGSERLEIMISGSLLLWLFYSGFLLLKNLPRPGLSRPRTWLAPVCALVYLAGSVGLVAVDPHLPSLAIFLTGWLVSSGLCIIVSDAVARSSVASGLPQKNSGDNE
jgi:hypothetical protein